MVPNKNNSTFHFYRPSAEELQGYEFFKDVTKASLTELLKNTSPLQLMKL